MLMKYGAESCRSDCGVERTLDIIANRWTSLILRELLQGNRRFNQLKNNLPGISPKTLTLRLRELEEQGLLTRTAYPQVPPRVEYRLTAKGEAIRPIFAAMLEWGQRWT